MSPRPALKDHYAALFAARERHLVGASVPWLARLRRSGMERFDALELPTRRDEAWRFTDPGPLTATPFGEATPELNLSGLSGIAMGPLCGLQLVFVNGHFEPRLSSVDTAPAGVTVAPLREFLTRKGASADRDLDASLGRVLAGPIGTFAALNTALFDDAACVHVARGVRTTVPVHILFATTDGAADALVCPRVVIVAEDGSSVAVAETHVGVANARSCTSAVTEVFVGGGARVEHYRLQRESTQAVHVASLAATVSTGGTFESHVVSLGAALARLDVTAVLAGAGASCTLNGLFEVTGCQVVDHHTRIDHTAVRGTSRQLYKGILSGRSRGVFDGAIMVRPGAQQTDAVQASKNLLLSDDAIIDTKPELQIYADDVKCRHGATVGQLDADVLFYLRSRGIGQAEAERLLIHAFASEILDQVPNEAIRAQLGGCLQTMALAEPAARIGSAV